MTEVQKNWAGNLTYSTTNVAYPDSVEAVQELVKNSSKLRVIGSRHSFNHIADSNSLLVSLQKLNRVVAIDREKQTVTVEAGIRYGDMCVYLSREGFAVHNMASLPHISVIGACSTATHGSGDKNGNLATAVSALEFVAANGEIVYLSRDKDGEQFKGAVVGLGGIGVVSDARPHAEFRCAAGYISGCTACRG
jgi:xylitol oxidase